MKKIIGLILVMLLCFSLVSVNAIEEVKVLTDLGIVTGYEDGTFKPNRLVTRAEMAKLLAAVAGADGTMIDDVFTDVPTTHWANGYINYGYTMGAIAGRGNGIFDPEGNVTFNEAIKMIVSLLGYEPVAKVKGGYPTGYLYVADNMIKITKGIEVRDGSRGTIAILLYNALEAPIMEQTSWSETNPEFVKGKGTLLKDYLEITKVEGTITDTYFNNFTDKEDKDITIETEEDSYTLAENGTGAENYFGYTVIAYIKDIDDDRELVAVAPKNNKNETLEVAFDDFEEKSIEEKKNYLTFEYYVDAEDEKPLTAKVDKEATYYLNGEEEDAIDFTNKHGIDGAVRLLDNDGNGIYDFVFIEEVDEEVIVKAINEKNYKITNKKGGSITLDPEDEDKYITFIKDGEVIGFNDIAEDDVLSIVKLYDDKVLKVYVSSKTIEGRVSSTTGDKYKINNVKYTISNDCEDTIAKGDEGTFYLNYNGKIAYKDTEVTAAAGDGYAFVLDVSTKETMFEDNVPVVLMMNEKGEWITAAFAEKVTFYANNDKIAVKLEDLSEIADASNNYFAYVNDEVVMDDVKNYRIIQYKLNSKNEITAITIPEDMTSAKVNDEDFGLVDVFKDAEYDINRNRFAAINGKGGVDKNTLVFAIDSEKELSEIIKKSEVSVANYSIFKDEECYTGLAFDCYDEVYQCMIITNAESAIPEDAMFLIVDEATEDLNDDDEIYYVVEGYMNGEKVILETEPDFDVALDEYADGAVLEVALDGKIITDVKEIYVYDDPEAMFGVFEDITDYDYEDEEGVAYYLGYLVDEELDGNYTYVGDYEINIKNANVTFVNHATKTVKYSLDENIEDYLDSLIFDENENLDKETMLEKETVVYFALVKVVDGYAIDIVVYGEEYKERV